MNIKNKSRVIWSGLSVLGPHSFILGARRASVAAVAAESPATPSATRTPVLAALIGQGRLHLVRPGLTAAGSYFQININVCVCTHTPSKTLETEVRRRKGKVNNSGSTTESASLSQEISASFRSVAVYGFCLRFFKCKKGQSEKEFASMKQAQQLCWKYVLGPLGTWMSF